MIRVNADYVIDVDENNYVVKEDKHRTRTNRDKTGIENIYVTCGYYSSLDRALEGVRKEMIKARFRQTDSTLEEAVNEIRKANAELNKAIKKVIAGK